MTNHNVILYKKNSKFFPSYSLRLCNKDLAPKNNQDWSWYNIFSFWMSDIHSISGYFVVSSFFTLGLANWQVILCLLLGVYVVQIFANVIAKPSQITGVPYAVISRQAFGVFGANIPAIIRGLNSSVWYGIQTYLASNALMLVLIKIFPILKSFSQSNWLGLSLLGWYCFLSMWFLQALIFWNGMDTIKRFINIAGPIVYCSMLVLAGWILYKIGFDNITLNMPSKQLSNNEQFWHILTVTSLVVSYFSGALLNFGDFSRYTKNMKEIRRGNFWGLPFNFLLFTIIVLIIVSGTESLFGRMIIDPIESINMMGTNLIVLISLLTVITATISVNIVVNFVSFALDFSNCAPQIISFRTGGMIAAVGSILLTPWNLFKSPELIHYTLNVLGSFIGPLLGIFITDFYIVKRGTVFVDDLFNDTSTGRYWYKNGFNQKAIFALIPAVVIHLIISIFPSLHRLENFSWFIGAILAGSFYRWLSRGDIAMSCNY